MRSDFAALMCIMPLLAAACAPTTPKADNALDCAAVISAATNLHVKGKIKLGQDMHNRTLVSGMTYLNMYAVPQNIAERDAFAAMNARRDEMLATHKPGKIKSRALTCIRRTPKV